MNIAVCLDNNFVMQAGVFITSLCVSNIHNDITFYILSDALSEENKNQLQQITDKYSKQIVFAKIDMEKLKDFPIRKGDHLSLAAYFRILLPVLLPENLDKVMYADCDMLVVDDLKDFYDTDITNYSTAITADMFYDDERITNRLLYDVKDHYFNSSMLLINLEWWRKNEITKKTLTFISENKDRCLAHDQDALCAILHGTILTAPGRYNIQFDFLRKNPSNMIIKDKSVLEDALASPHNPAIIHFTGPTKPWHTWSFNPYDKLWDYFQDRTIWKDQPKQEEYTGYMKFKKYVKHILGILHLMPKLIDKYINVDKEIEMIKTKYAGIK